MREPPAPLRAGTGTGATIYSCGTRRLRPGDAPGYTTPRVRDDGVPDSAWVRRAPCRERRREPETTRLSPTGFRPDRHG
jgi:hypothetical protein